ncbi:hypothetical protein [Paraburkholderia sp. 2C]
MNLKAPRYINETEKERKDFEIFAPHQLEAFAASEADMAGAFTMNDIDEALGIALAAKACGECLAAQPRGTRPRHRTR